MEYVNVTTQAELDRVVANGDIPVCRGNGHFVVTGQTTVEAWDQTTVEASGQTTVRASDQTTVEASGQTTVRASDQTTVEASDQTTVEAWDQTTVRASVQTTVRAWDQTTVEASDQTTVEAWDQTTVRTSGQTTVEAWGQTTVVAWGQTTVEAWGQTTVEASGQTTVRASDQTTVRASGQTTVRAWDQTTVRASVQTTVGAWDQTTVRAWGQTTVEAWDQTTVRAWDQTTVRASKFVAIHRNGDTPKVKGGVIIQIPAMDTAEEFFDYYGSDVKRGKTIVYKLLDENFVSDHGTTYTPGTTATCPDWNARAECGGGLHFSPHPFMARKYSNGTRFVACEVKVSDVVVIPQSVGAPDKLKTQACKVLHECNEDGEKI